MNSTIRRLRRQTLHSIPAASDDLRWAAEFVQTAAEKERAYALPIFLRAEEESIVEFGIQEFERLAVNDELDKEGKVHLSFALSFWPNQRKLSDVTLNWAKKTYFLLASSSDKCDIGTCCNIKSALGSALPP